MLPHGILVSTVLQISNFPLLSAILEDIKTLSGPRASDSPLISGTCPIVSQVSKWARHTGTSLPTVSTSGVLALLGPLVWVHWSSPSGGATNDTLQINSASTLDTNTTSHSDEDSAQGTGWIISVKGYKYKLRIQCLRPNALLNQRGVSLLSSAKKMLVSFLTMTQADRFPLYKAGHTVVLVIPCCSLPVSSTI